MAWVATIAPFLEKTLPRILCRNKKTLIIQWSNIYFNFRKNDISAGDIIVVLTTRLNIYLTYS